MKRKYLMFTIMTVMALSLAACGKKTEEQPQEQTEEVTEEVTEVPEIEESTPSDAEDKKSGVKYGSLIINNDPTDNYNNGSISDNDATNTDSDADSNDTDDNDTTDTSRNQEYQCTDDVAITLPINSNPEQTSQDDSGNPRIMVTLESGERLLIDMTETPSDAMTHLQDKLYYLMSHPDEPYNAASSGMYNDTVYANETYTILDKYYSNKSESSIYMIKMTSDDDEVPYCYYIVASDILTNNSKDEPNMMVVRTADTTDDAKISDIAKIMFGK